MPEIDALIDISVGVHGTEDLYNRFKNAKRNKIHFGLIAQEVEKVFPNIVYQTGDDKKAVCYLEIIPLLLLKVKDLERQIQELK